MKKLSEIFTIIIFFTILISNNAQAQYELNKHYIGPEIGFVFNSSTIQFGANYEYAMQLKEIGNIGVGGIFRYWSYGNTYLNYTDIIVGAQGNYHFKMGNNKLDIWSGLVLGYDFGSWSSNIPNSNWVEPSYGGFLFVLNGGGRYWISSKIAVTGRLGFGTLSYGVLEIGVDFKL